MFFALKEYTLDTIGVEGFNGLVHDVCGIHVGIADDDVSKEMRMLVDADVLDVSKILGKGFDIARKLPQSTLDDLMDRVPAQRSHYVISRAQIEGVVQEHQTGAIKTAALEARAKAESMKRERSEAQYAKLEYMWNRLMIETKVLPSMKMLFSKGTAAYDDSWITLNKEIKQLQEDSKKLKKAQEQSKKEVKARRSAEIKLEIAHQDIAQLKNQLIEQAKSTHDELPCPTVKTLAARERRLADKCKEVDELRFECQTLDAKLKAQTETATEDVEKSHLRADTARKEMIKMQDDNEIQMMRHAEEISTISDDYEKTVAEREAECAVLRNKNEALNKKNVKYLGAIERYKEEYAKLKKDRDELRDDVAHLKQKATADSGSQDAFGVGEEGTELSRLTAELKEQDRVTQHFQQSLGIMKKQMTEAKDGLDLAKARIEQQNEEIENFVSELHDCKQERDEARITARRSQLKLVEYEQTQKAVLDEIDNERAKSKRIQEKLGEMMSTFVAAGLPLP